jgi:hypothetical protein
VIVIVFLGLTKPTLYRPDEARSQESGGGSSTPVMGNHRGSADLGGHTMGMTGTMKGYGTAARFRAEAVSHRMKDRVLEKRLDRTAHEAEHLRLENQLLRDEVEDSRTEHHRIPIAQERISENRNRTAAAGRKGIGC